VIALGLNQSAGKGTVIGVYPRQAPTYLKSIGLPLEPPDRCAGRQWNSRKLVFIQSFEVEPQGNARLTTARIVAGAPAAI
jgi:hypothetical protein